MASKDNTETHHLPVMADEVLTYLDCRPGGLYVDGTLGAGGHTRRILDAAPGCRVIALDCDGEAVERAKRALKPYKDRVTILRENFRDVCDVLKRLSIDKVDGVVLDLGVSSMQLDTTERGFSFRRDARLDMRMDTREKLTAYDLVNGLKAGELEDIFRRYGEERRAKSIARAIERRRMKAPISTTAELAELVASVMPPKARHGRIHPATRVFQALRIAVNSELDCIEQGVEASIEVLGAGGRLVVISFHSLEDRLVKHKLRALSASCTCPPRALKCICDSKPKLKVITKKVVKPTPGEVERNPRARSAKLRAAERL